MTEQTIKAMINTLNQMEVKGKDNLDRLLGCIMVLEKALNEMNAPKKPEGGEQDGKC